VYRQNCHKFENQTTTALYHYLKPTSNDNNMQRIANIIKPSILKRGKYQSKMTDDDESEEIPLKQSHPRVSRQESFRLSKMDSSRSITSQDQTLQSSISTFNSSISSISSAPYHYDDALSGNESYSSLQHIEKLKPRRSRAVQDDNEPKSRRSRAVRDDDQVQPRKPRSFSLSKKRSPKPQAAPSTNAPKPNSRGRSKTVQAEQEVPCDIMSKSLSSKRNPTVQRSKSSRRITDPNANVLARQRSSSSRRLTDFKTNAAPQNSTKTGTRSLDDFMNQYDEIMVEFPDARPQKEKDYSGSKSVTGW
jgi:hypothetical protein